jgi:tRNA 5-methylaminomethyl-2-thiouridine biosynthesis bifunctional protein
MSRLPPLPALTFREDATPVAEAVGDVYFSTADGLSESEAVFLAGCGLPQAWEGRERFTVGELGFGTGLNLLALWRLWRAHRPPATARLDFVSFEGFPMPVAAAARALAAWPEIAELAGRLLAAWPVRAFGVQRVELGDGVSLTLHTGDIGQTLPQAQLLADAWFLDGFSPAKNPDMWSDAVLACVAERTVAGGRAASFTVAGGVRRGLAAAGFAVEKRAGFGRKRERLEAVRMGGPERGVAVPSRVAVIGAGIAGACLARAFRVRGASVQVFEAGAGVAQGASGNPLALVHPRLDAADTAQARLQIAASLHAHRLYGEVAAGWPEAVLPVEVVQGAKDAVETARFAKLRADPPLPQDWLGFGEDGALLHRKGALVRPEILIPALLEGCEVVAGREVPAGAMAGFDLTVVAGAMGAQGLVEALSLTPRGGQVEWLLRAGEAFALTRSNYAAGDGRVMLFGANFGDEAAGRQASSLARDGNLAAFEALCPQRAQGVAGGSPPYGSELHSRAGVRATTPDRMPVAGAVGPGLAVLTGLGSRGFSLAPLMAEWIAAQACGEAWPLSRAEAALVEPQRFARRKAKAG